jgi:hypothetical protein
MTFVYLQSAFLNVVANVVLNPLVEPFAQGDGGVDRGDFRGELFFTGSNFREEFPLSFAFTDPLGCDSDSFRSVGEFCFGDAIGGFVLVSLPSDSYSSAYATLLAHPHLR